MQMENGQNGVFSIGYSVHEVEHFLRLLRQAGVTLLADVRTHPSSRYMPLYNRPDLEAALRSVGIGYVFLGDDLGGRPQSRELYDPSGRVNYVRTRATDFFRRGLDRLCALAADGRVAMMCGEEDPLDCHRGLMITPALGERDVAPYTCAATAAWKPPRRWRTACCVRRDWRVRCSRTTRRSGGNCWCGRTR